VYEVEGFIYQQQSSISLAAVVVVNRILNVSVPDPFFPDPKKKKKKWSGYARLIVTGFWKTYPFGTSIGVI